MYHHHLESCIQISILLHCQKAGKHKTNIEGKADVAIGNYFQLAHIISYNHLYHRMKIGQKFRNPKIVYIAIYSYLLIYFCGMRAQR